MRRAAATALAAAAPFLALPARVRAQAAAIRIGGAINDSYAETFFAQDAGFYARAGLNVEMTTFANAPSMVQAVVGNAIDVGMADAIQIANAHNHGVPLAFFAGGGLYVSSAPTSYLCIAKDSPIKTAKDLEGQTVAVVALTSTGTSTIREWLHAANVDPAAVKIFELPFAAMAPALARGTIAAAFIGEPFISMGKNEIKPLADTQSVIAKTFYVAASFATRDWLAKNRATAHLLTQTIYEAARWSNAHHDETAAILAKYTKLEIERIRAMTRVQFATSLEPRLLQPNLDFGLKTGALEKATNAADLIALV